MRRLIVAATRRAAGTPRLDRSGRLAFFSFSFARDSVLFLIFVFSSSDLRPKKRDIRPAATSEKTAKTPSTLRGPSAFRSETTGVASCRTRTDAIRFIKLPITTTTRRLLFSTLSNVPRSLSSPPGRITAVGRRQRGHIPRSLSRIFYYFYYYFLA